MSRYKAYLMLAEARDKYKMVQDGAGYIFTDQEMQEFIKALHDAWLEETAQGIAKMIDQREAEKT